jgi:hypothetical protein
MPDATTVTVPKKHALLESFGIKVPTGQQVYDALMRKIEPELITANLKKLDAPYKNESEADRKARYKRYSKAFQEYKKQFKDWSDNLRNAVKNFRRAVIKAAEKKNRTEEETAMQALEAQMQ